MKKQPRQYSGTKQYVILSNGEVALTSAPTAAREQYLAEKAERK